MHLWEVDHPYYCNQGNYYAPGNQQPTMHYESWQEFFDAEGDSDADMNLLFRFDWRKADPNGENWGNKTDQLSLFWIGQRKVLYRWSTIEVMDADEPAARAWLQTRLDCLLTLWEPLLPSPQK